MLPIYYNDAVSFVNMQENKSPIKLKWLIEKWGFADYDVLSSAD